MRKSMSNVLSALSAGKAAKETVCSTDGVSVFSYQTKVAQLLPRNRIWITTETYSRTTNCQVSAIRLYASINGLTVVN